MGTLIPHSNGDWYTGRLAMFYFATFSLFCLFLLLLPLMANNVVYAMGGLLDLVQQRRRRGAWAGCGPAQSPPRCTKSNSPPINGQCTKLHWM